MRRLLFVLLPLVILIFFTVTNTKSYAQEKVVETDTPIGIDVTATESSAMQGKVNYEFPYPGMLPDNPFYFLKVIRDGVVKLLINDSMKRARFSLLNSEKRMYAGKLLVDKGKDGLALSTISKGNNYLDEALAAAKNYKRQLPRNVDAKLFFLQLRSSILKQKETMQLIKPKIDEQFQNSFLIEEKRLSDNQKNVDNFLLQK